MDFAAFGVVGLAVNLDYLKPIGNLAQKTTGETLMRT